MVTTTDALPAVTASIELHLADGQIIRSTVADRGPSGLSVAATTQVDVRVGTHLVVAWTTRSGLHRVSTRVTALGHSRIRTWSLEPTSDIQTTQRRESYRVGLSAGVVLRQEGNAHDATLVDLSEGGLRCDAEPPPTPGTPVRAELRLPSGILTLPGNVLRVAPVEQAGRTEVAIAFGEVTEAAATVLRRELWAAQVATRRNED